MKPRIGPTYSCVLLLLLSLLLCRDASALRCWQCAAVGGRRCPAGAEAVDSLAHDSCITWTLGNGSVILQVSRKQVFPNAFERTILFSRFFFFRTQ